MFGVAPRARSTVAYRLIVRRLLGYRVQGNDLYADTCHLRNRVQMLRRLCTPLLADTTDDSLFRCS